jgi:hypothetical protein
MCCVEQLIMPGMEAHTGLFGLHVRMFVPTDKVGWDLQNWSQYLGASGRNDTYSYGKLPKSLPGEYNS